MPFAIDQDKMESAAFRSGSMDIGNPPNKPIPYQEFPRMVYHEKLSRPAKINLKINEVTGAESEVHVPEKRASKVVNNEEELKRALEAGWTLKPPVFEAEIGDMEVEKPRRGRTPKAE